METIDKFQFLYHCIEKDMYQQMSWMQQAFSITRQNPYWEEPLHPYKLQDKWWVKMEKGAEPILITGDYSTDRGLLYHKFDKISIPAGAVKGVTADMDTTLGRLVFYCITRLYPFDGKLPFLNKKHDNKTTEMEIAKLLTDDVDPGDEEEPSKVYVREYLKFTEAAGMYLASTTQLFTPAATKKTLTVNPAIRKRRDELIELNHGKLTDPAVIAGMKRELLQMDKDDLKDDPGADYLIGYKSFNIIRMKTLIMHGEENAFGDGTQVTFIPTSIDEGMNLDYFPDYVNSGREGSFNRGYQTMLGGEAFSFLSRIFQNTAITEEDCGRRVGRRIFIPVSTAKEYVGYFVITDDKRLIETTEENIGQFAGKKVTLRSAMYCGTGGGNYCATCMGRSNARFPKALGTMGADFGSLILLMFMGKAHATELKTYRYDPFTALT